MSMQLVSGISHITVDGAEYAVADDLVKFEMAIINREPVVSKNGSVFLKETPQPAKLSFNILVPSGVDVGSFNERRDSNIVVHLANGSVLNANGMASTGNQEYDSGAGTVSLEWFGPSINVTLGA